MTDIINRLGEMSVHKMRIINRIRKNKGYEDNLRKCPWYSEFCGMCQTLRCMGMDVEIDWCPDDVYTMSAITIMGIRFDV